MARRILPLLIGSASDKTDDPLKALLAIERADYQSGSTDQ
jgi:hypothetical protein